jgi:uncharacterized phiE125 gp8 family phage protein
MYHIQVISPPASEPVSLSELKAHLRLNDDSEDALLIGFIKAAREFFERYTGRIVLPTTLRQHVYYLTGPVYLMRGNVTSIEDFYYYDQNDSLTELTEYHEDTISLPSSVWLDSYPTTSPTKTPNAYVTFVAGWADTNAVPEMVKVGIKLLAAHYYEQRNSHSPEDLKTVPMGFKSICDQFKTGLVGDWGQ